MRIPELAELARVAGSQEGLFTRSDVGDAGLDNRFRLHMVDSGEWVPVFPGVWRAVTTPVTVAMREVGALLWLGDDAALSHLSAARRYRLPVPATSQVWVTLFSTTAKPRPQAGVVLTRSKVGSAVLNVSGARCVEADRAVADLAHCLPASATKSALLAAVQRRLAHVDRLDHVCAALGNRPGNGELRRLLALFDPALESWLEDQWAMAQQRLGIQGWQRQLKIVDRSGRVVSRADFGDEAAKLAVQLDGFAFHSTVQQLSRDKAMDRATARVGFLTLRFDADDVSRRLDACVQEAEEMRTMRLRLHSA
jgi:very-short-patch-repair endonuclease